MIFGKRQCFVIFQFFNVFGSFFFFFLVQAKCHLVPLHWREGISTADISKTQQLRSKTSWKKKALQVEFSHTNTLKLNQRFYSRYNSLKCKFEFNLSGNLFLQTYRTKPASCISIQSDTDFRHLFCWDTQKLLFQEGNLGQIIISGSRHRCTQPPIPSPPPPSATGVGLSVSMVTPYPSSL